MRVHINEIKGKKIGYKIRWTEDGKPKEAFRKEYKDATALQASVRERLVGDSKEEYRKTHLSDSQQGIDWAYLLSSDCTGGGFDEYDGESLFLFCVDYGKVA